MGNLKERLIAYISYKGLTVQSFEKSIGLSNGAVSKMGDNTRMSTLDRVSNFYPDLNRSWLLTGEGDMLKSGTSNANQTQSTPKKSDKRGVPYYNVDFIGGFDLVINDQTATPEYLIDYEPYNKATCWCNITGHSMEPEINHGDMLALKEITDTSFLPVGEVYAIVTKNDMRTVKRLGPSDTPGCYTLVPTNKSPEYGVQELPKVMIERIFSVLGCMKRF